MGEERSQRLFDTMYIKRLKPSLQGDGTTASQSPAGKLATDGPADGPPDGPTDEAYRDLKVCYGRTDQLTNRSMDGQIRLKSLRRD